MKNNKKVSVFLLLTIILFGSIYLCERSQNKIRAFEEKNQQPIAQTMLQERSNDPKVVPLENIFSIPSGADSSVEGNYVFITKRYRGQIGSIFSTENNKINLSQDFVSEMFIKIDGVADGVTFVMHNDYERIKKYTGMGGEGLGVYAGSTNNGSLVGQIKNSFVVEFDTYHNGDSNDSGLDLNYFRGHIAHSFPDDKNTYEFNSSGKVIAQKHFEIKYPSFGLGDNQWRKFRISWKAFNDKGIGELAYKLDETTWTRVDIPKSVFNSNSVYWGFTGSTGDLTESAIVGFASVPGLVNYEDDLKLLNSSGEVLNRGQVIKGDSELTVSYSGKYIGGKQNLLGGSITFNKDSRQSYVEETMLINDVPVTPIVTSDEIKVDFGDLSISKNILNIQYKIKNNGFSSKDKPEIKSLINASNFNQASGKTTSYTIDNQPPNGIGKLTIIDQKDVEKITMAGDYKKFLSVLTDDFSAKDKITVRLRPNQEIESIVNQLGPNNFDLFLEDEVGNARIVKVPIFIKKQADRLTNNLNYVLKGTNFKLNDQEYPKTAGDLEKFIFSNAVLELWKFNDDGTYNKMADNLIQVNVSQLPVPGTIPPSKEYLVPISCNSVGLKLDIPFTVEPGSSSVKIDFFNEEGKPLRDPIVLKEKIGVTIDLTKETAIQERLRELKGNHYEQVKAPVNETSILVEKEPKTLYYQFEGTLFLKSLPTKINFGDTYLNSQFIKAEQPIYDIPLIIGDNRSNKTSWELTATLEKNLTSVEDPNEVLPRAIWYKKNEREKVLLSKEEAQKIEVGTISATGEYNISNDWKANKTGLELNLFSNEVVQKGKYQATILWQVEKVPK